MNKSDYFKMCLKAGNYKHLGWAITCFSLFSGSGENKGSNYKYGLTRNDSGFWFKNDSGENVKISDALPNEPLLKFLDNIIVNPGDIPNCNSTVKTTYGNLFSNWVLLVYPFGDKIPFIVDKMNIGKIERIVINNLYSDVDDISNEEKSKFYVREYLIFADSIAYMTGLDQLSVPAATKKSLLPAPGIDEYKDKLIEESKNELHNPAVIAGITKKLTEYDFKYLEGDKSMGFLGANEKTKKARIKKYQIYGGVPIHGSNDVKLVANSLYQGMDINAWPELMTSLRFASYSRGAETVLGGVEVKNIIRSAANLMILDNVEDCGSKVGEVRTVTDFNIKQFVKRTIIKNGKNIFIPDLNTAKQFLGEVVMVRTGMYCKLTKTDYCKTCVGEDLAKSPKSLPSECTSYGMDFLALFLAKAHGSTLSVEKASLIEIFS